MASVRFASLLSALALIGLAEALPGQILVAPNPFPSSDLLIDGTVQYRAPYLQPVLKVGAPVSFDQFRFLGFQQGPDPGALRPLAPPPAPLASFASATDAPVALITAPDGTIYGVRPGAPGDGEIVRVEVTPAGATVTALATFSPTLGTQPAGPLRIDAQGRVLGLTRAGAANGKGGLFRFDPATGELELVAAFPTTLPGVANALVPGADGNFYGASSVLAERGTIVRPTSWATYTGTPEQLRVGAGVAEHGCLFRVGAEGTFTVLKTFGEGETVTVDEAAGPGEPVQRSYAVPSGITLSLGSAPAVNVAGPGTLTLTAAGAWTFESESGATSTGTLSPNQRLGLEVSGPVGAYFPCSLGQTPTGDLLCWVSGGLYLQPVDGGAGKWVLAPAEVLLRGTDLVLLGYFLGSRGEVSGRYFGQLGNGGIILRDEAPPMEPLPGGGLFVARDRAEWELTAAGYTARSVPPTKVVGTEIYSAYGNDSTSTRYLRGPALLHPGGRFRFESKAAPSSTSAAVPSGLAFATNERARVLADFADLRCGTLLPAAGGAPELLCVAAPREAHAPLALYRLGSDFNHPPIAKDFVFRSDRGTALTVGGTPMRRFEATLPPIGSDPNGDPLTLAIETPPVRGTVDIDGTTLRYLVAEPAGDDHFTYTITDAPGLAVAGHFRVLGSVPAVQGDIALPAGTDAQGRLLFRVAPLANDLAPEGLALGALISPSAPGMDGIQVTAEGDEFVFAVAPPALTRLVTYAVSDGYRLRLGQIRIGNRAPAPSGTAVVANGLTTALIDPARLAPDPDRDPLTLTVLTPPANGTLEPSGNSFIYRPNGSVVGDDYFTAEVRDAFGGVATVTVLVRNPFATLPGTHVAVVGETDQRAGVLRATLTPSGSATVQLRVHGRTYRGSADVPASGDATVSLMGPRSSDVLLRLRASDKIGHALEGEAVIDGGYYAFILDPKVTPPTDHAGSYNVVLERQVPVAMHYGFAIARLNTRGEARINGRTPDNRPWTTNAVLTEGNHLAVFAQIGGTARSVAGAWHFNDGGGLEAVDGDLFWKRQAVEETLVLAGTRYVPPRGLANVFGARQTPMTLVFSTPGLRNATTTRLTLDSNNTAAQLTTGPWVRLSVNRATGVFSGYAMLEAKPVASPFVGVLRGTEGFGIVVSPGGIGSVVLLSRNPPALNLFWMGSVLGGGFEETTIHRGP